MWDEYSDLFITDYFAQYLIKITTYVFVFEMLRVFIYITSATLEINQTQLKYRKLLMRLVYGIHSICIVIILLYNYNFLILKDVTIKMGTLGALYQMSKFCVLTADLTMLILFYRLFSFFVHNKRESIRAQSA